MRSNAVSLPSSSIHDIPDFTLPVRPRRKKEVRDPYDGLRPWSAITHGVGAVLSAVGTVALLLRSAALGNVLGFWVFLIYGLSMTGLYTASTLYHCVNTSVAGRIALRKYDHCSIYLLIAGSYTPVCLLGLRDSGGAILLAVVWAVGLLGMILTIAKPSLIHGSVIATVTVLGYTAMAATLGGTGLGQVAIIYGHQRSNADVIWVCVVLIWIVVQVIQFIGELVARKTDKRIR